MKSETVRDMDIIMYVYVEKVGHAKNACSRMLGIVMDGCT
jgi:hypothetical protein